MPIDCWAVQQQHNDCLHKKHKRCKMLQSMSLMELEWNAETTYNNKIIVHFISFYFIRAELDYSFFAS